MSQYSKNILWKNSGKGRLRKSGENPPEMPLLSLFGIECDPGMFPKKLKQDLRSVFRHATIPAFPAPYSVVRDVKVVARQHRGGFALGELVARAPIL